MFGRANAGCSKPARTGLGGAVLLAELVFPVPKRRLGTPSAKQSFAKKVPTHRLGAGESSDESCQIRRHAGPDAEGILAAG